MHRLLLVLLCACTVEAGHAPVARITAMPRAIPERDSFQTDVILDGSSSADPLDDPDGGAPLAFLWEITGDEARIQQGTMTSPELTVRFLGSRPATVRLIVTDGSGDSGAARLQMRLSVPIGPDAGPVPDAPVDAPPAPDAPPVDGPTPDA